MEQPRATHWAPFSIRLNALALVPFAPFSSPFFSFLPTEKKEKKKNNKKTGSASDARRKEKGYEENEAEDQSSSTSRLSKEGKGMAETSIPRIARWLGQSDRAAEYDEQHTLLYIRSSNDMQQ